VPGVPGDEDTTLIELAKGNNVYLPTTSRNTDRSPVGVPAAKRSKTENHDGSDDAVVSTKSGMVMFNGALVDLKKLMDQMQRSDRARDDTEQILSDIRKVNAELTSSNSKATTKIKDLQSDVKSLSRKLTDTEQSLNTANVSFPLYDENNKK
jgi:seryl-tRNA synthetase